MNVDYTRPINYAYGYGHLTAAAEGLPHKLYMFAQKHGIDATKADELYDFLRETVASEIARTHEAAAEEYENWG